MPTIVFCVAIHEIVANSFNRFLGVSIRFEIVGDPALLFVHPRARLCPLRCVRRAWEGASKSPRQSHGYMAAPYECALWVCALWVRLMSTLPESPYEYSAGIAWCRKCFTILPDFPLYFLHVCCNILNSKHMNSFFFTFFPQGLLELKGFPKTRVKINMNS